MRKGKSRWLQKYAKKITKSKLMYKTVTLGQLVNCYFIQILCS